MKGPSERKREKESKEEKCVKKIGLFRERYSNSRKGDRLNLMNNNKNRNHVGQC
jgi:hypothetical protein